MRVQVLASSSAGNCTLVRSGRTTLLIDCGLGPERMRGLLRDAGLDLAGISGVLVTHTHGDHLHRGMLGALRRSGVPLVCADPVAHAIGGQLELFGGPSLPEIRTLPNRPLQIGTLEVEHFAVPHDAPGGCFGFIVRRPGTRGAKTLALATDIGHAEPDLPGWIAAADLAVLESNHDLKMLLASGRPQWLIHRIRTRGHLSNEESAGLLQETLAAPRSRVRHVVLAHLSEECNRPALALKAATRALKESGKEKVSIESAHTRIPTAAIDL